MKNKLIVVVAAVLASGTVACTGAPNAGKEAAGNKPVPETPAAQQSTTAAQRPMSEATASTKQPLATTVAVDPALPLVIVHKSPTCGCCVMWVEHLRAAGFGVEVRNSDDLDPIKQSLGVPADKASCHTAQVGDYFVEGHVPAEDIKRLLAQKPEAKGLTVPGMPAGSPGMENPSGITQPYTVELVGRDGSTSAFAEH